MNPYELSGIPVLKLYSRASKTDLTTQETKVKETKIVPEDVDDDDSVLTLDASHQTSLIGLRDLQKFRPLLAFVSDVYLGQYILPKFMMLTRRCLHCSIYFLVNCHLSHPHPILLQCLETGNCRARARTPCYALTHFALFSAHSLLGSIAWWKKCSTCHLVFGIDGLCTARSSSTVAAGVFCNCLCYFETSCGLGRSG
jgi:hypothetical protein